MYKISFNFNFKITFIGPENVGKSQLINRLVGNEFLPNIPHTLVPTYTPKMLPTIKDLPEGQIHYWETHEDPDMSQTNALIYCIDLTEEIDVIHINQAIQKFLAISPNMPIIFVGTKHEQDQKIPNERIEEFNTNIHPQQNLRFMCSAKKGTGLAELSNAILSLVHREYQIQYKQHQWDDAVKNLQVNLAGLNRKKAQYIQDQFSQMVTILDSHPHDHGAKAIELFVNQSKAILQGKHSNAMNAVIRVAAVAIITILAGLIGFSFGFTAGLWIGPGAFLTGLVGMGVGATLGSTISMGMVGHRWFIESKRSSAIDQFAIEASCANEPVESVNFQP